MLTDKIKYEKRIENLRDYKGLFKDMDGGAKRMKKEKKTLKGGGGHGGVF